MKKYLKNEYRIVKMIFDFGDFIEYSNNRIFGGIPSPSMGPFGSI